MKIINIILLVSILTICSSCIGQNTPENIGDKTIKSQVLKTGNPVSAMDKGIMVIFQDSQNNYWFGGGEKGVYKYNKKGLVLYTVKDGLCSTSILGIQEDKLGNIYFDTQEGVSKFDGQKFTTLEVMASNTSRNEWKLEPDDLWFRMGWNNNGPYRYDGEFLYPLEFPKTGLADEFYAKYPNASFTPYGIYSLYTDSGGAVWFGTSSLGACRFDGKTISWLYERHLVETLDGGNPGIRSIIEDKDGYFWFSNTRYRFEILSGSTDKNGTSRINYKRRNGVGKSTSNEEENFPYFMSIAENNDGDLWMATYSDGVWRNDGKKLIHYPVKDGNADVSLFSIYKDNQGVLWLVTHNAGVYKFDGEKFEPFKY